MTTSNSKANILADTQAQKITSQAVKVFSDYTSAKKIQQLESDFDMGGEAKTFQPTQSPGIPS